MDRDLSGKAIHRQSVQYQGEIKARKHLSEKAFNGLCTSECATSL